jgi:S1-C subfamily serine protease
LPTVVALTSTISVLLTLGVVAPVRPVRTRLAVQQVAPPADPGKALASADDVAGIADRLRAAISHVAVDAPSGARHGSGVVYRTDGLLLTTHHVVDGATRTTVTLDDGRSFDARVIGSDPDTDIAVLDLDGDDFDVAPLGSAMALKVGQAAIMIGTPAAGPPRPVVSVGVVSATGQAVDVAGGQLIDMIQTDTAVGSGCAGGAVVDAAGVVVGIATVNSSAEGSVSGYATPIDVARLVASQLVAHGKVMRGWLGVEGDDLSDERSTELAVDGGVVVKAVKASSPALEAGLRASDVITEIDGEHLESMTELVVELRTRRPGDTVAIAVVRDGARKVMKARLAEKP